MQGLQPGHVSVTTATSVKLPQQVALTTLENCKSVAGFGSCLTRPIYFHIRCHFCVESVISICCRGIHKQGGHAECAPQESQKKSKCHQDRRTEIDCACHIKRHSPTPGRAGALVRPKGMTIYSKWPSGVLKAILHSLRLRMCTRW